MEANTAAVMQCLSCVKHLCVCVSTGQQLSFVLSCKPFSKCCCVSAAISANMAIFVAKMATFWVSGSSAMLAESIHSVADIFNQVGHCCLLTSMYFRRLLGRRQCLPACTCADGPRCTSQSALKPVQLWNISVPALRLDHGWGVLVWKKGLPCHMSKVSSSSPVAMRCRSCCGWASCAQSGLPAPCTPTAT